MWLPSAPVGLWTRSELAEDRKWLHEVAQCPRGGGGGQPGEPVAQWTGLEALQCK
jgi:hypothetical protein